MLRPEFEAHPIWNMMDRIEGLLSQIRDQNDPSETSLIERVKFYVDHVRSFKALGTISSGLFSTEMLNMPVADFTNVEVELTNRLAYGAAHIALTNSAAVVAERSLMSLAAWPRPYAKGAQKTAMTTLFEDLLETQRNSVGALVTRHKKLLDEVEIQTAELDAFSRRVQSEISELRSEGLAVAVTVDAQKSRIDELVLSGTTSLNEASESNMRAFRDWMTQRETDFKVEVAPSILSVGMKAQAAEELLARMQETEVAYVALSAEVAAGELAKDFASEAKAGRRTGLWLYAVGFVFLVGSAAPLLFLLGSSEPSLGQLAVRVSIGLIGASAATVSIRLGARFITSANRSKKMELELRAFGPFLAAVTDPEMVDAARIDLVSRTFGTLDTESKGEDSVPVTAVSQLLELITKLAK